MMMDSPSFSLFSRSVFPSCTAKQKSCLNSGIWKSLASRFLIFNCSMRLRPVIRWVRLASYSPSAKRLKASSKVDVVMTWLVRFTRLTNSSALSPFITTISLFLRSSSDWISLRSVLVNTAPCNERYGMVKSIRASRSGVRPTSGRASILPSSRSFLMASQTPIFISACNPTA